MPKIVFNNFPKTRKPFPFEKFDNEIDLRELKLSYRIYHDDFSRAALLGIDVNLTHVTIAEIKLFHSGTLTNFEQTFDSAQTLLKEIVQRFNSFSTKGQLCLEL